MTDPFVAEIRIVPFNFAPTGWAHCDGQVLSISQNTALFSLLGTSYGGNGTTNFALPNLQGRAPIHHGQGAGLSQRYVGESGGTATVTLLESEIPIHNHNLMASQFEAEDNNAADLVPSIIVGGTLYSTNTTNLVQMSPSALSLAGGSLPHNNLQPYLVLNFIIALQGIFPPRS